MRTGIISAILESPSILREERQRVNLTVSPRHTRSSAPSVHLLMLRWQTREAGLRNAEKIWGGKSESEREEANVCMRSKSESVYTFRWQKYKVELQNPKIWKGEKGNNQQFIWRREKENSLFSQLIISKKQAQKTLPHGIHWHAWRGCMLGEGMRCVEAELSLNSACQLRGSVAFLGGAATDRKIVGGSWIPSVCFLEHQWSSRRRGGLGLGLLGLGRECWPLSLHNAPPPAQ